ncbi:MAG: diguanylate cyclase [Candidatus Marinimicrobia bacterium]|nr:diguanylate cyclase [Candidatus Neomarinimicrobiota bacterium]
MPILNKNTGLKSDNPNNFSVLLCDQDQDSRNLISEFLSGDGGGKNGGVKFHVSEANDRDQIEQALNDSPPEVVILALNLKGKSMMEWLDEINSRNVAPAVVLAAKGDELIAVESMKRGAYDYIPKSALTRETLTSSLIHARDRWNHLKAVEDERLELERMAMFDSLTDLLSRRALLEQMDIEIMRSHRYGRHLSMLMLDIDRFKRVNDKHGHVAGDAVIRAISATIKEQIRGSDFAGRYGGEEFIVLLPETPLKKATVLAEKLRKSIEKLKVKVEGHTLDDLAVSIGVAEFREGDEPTDIINRSDQGLYKAKRGGRNRVAVQT